MSVRPIAIVALDVPDKAGALAMVDALGELCRFYKVGSELYTAAGPSVVQEIRTRGAEVFLDLKFHDIPNTVFGSVRAVATLGARLLTVHASGGRAMLAAAAEAARESGADCGVLAVTVLTSLDPTSLGESWGRRDVEVEQEVLRLARLADDVGLHGVVCSGRESAMVRSAFGGRLATLVPGVRLAGSARQDQARVVTPRQAAESGASYIVVGRPITAAKEPRSAMQLVLSDLP